MFYGAIINSQSEHIDICSGYFYEKSGFSKYGEIGLDEWCPHIWMKKVLV